MGDTCFGGCTSWTSRHTRLTREQAYFGWGIKHIAKSELRECDADSLVLMPSSAIYIDLLSLRGTVRHRIRGFPLVLTVQFTAQCPTAALRHATFRKDSHDLLARFARYRTLCSASPKGKHQRHGIARDQELRYVKAFICWILEKSSDHF